MKNISKQLCTLAALSMALSACSSFFDKDNTPQPTPLSNFTQTAQLQRVWSTRAGSGAGNEDLRLSPAIAGQTIYTSSRNGTITATDLTTGKSLWSTRTTADFSNGTATSDGLVFAGTSEGEMLAFRDTDGQQLWKTTISSEILAPAAAKDGIVLAKSIDGHIAALSTSTGRILWQYQESEPNLILRGSSAPQLSGNSAVVGFENGKLVKLNLRSGNIQWRNTIAEPDGVFAIQRMVDIDADPVIFGSRIYAATYQGRIAALDIGSGREIWSQDMSSYTGLATDGSKVFVSDARSHVRAFNAANGTPLWTQEDLGARRVSGVALLRDYVIAGDAEGYLHVLSKADGHFVARTYVGGGGILVTPIVKNNLVYVYTKDGQLTAYTVN